MRTIWQEIRGLTWAKFLDQKFLQVTTTRKYRYLKLGRGIGSHSPDVTTRCTTTKIVLLNIPKTLARFNEFPNLREIIVDQWEGIKCFDFHNAVLLCPTVEKFVSNYHSWGTICMPCFKALIDSLLNLTSISIGNWRSCILKVDVWVNFE